MNRIKSPIFIGRSTLLRLNAAQIVAHHKINELYHCADNPMLKKSKQKRQSSAGMSIREIALKLNMNYGTVYNTLNTALVKIKQELLKSGYRATSR